MALADDSIIRYMTTAEAQEEYERYCRDHKQTKRDPLRTFSGWLLDNKVKLTDWE